MFGVYFNLKERGETQSAKRLGLFLVSKRGECKQSKGKENVLSDLQWII